MVGGTPTLLEGFLGSSAASCEDLFSFAGIRVIRGCFFGHPVVEGVFEADEFAEGGALAREWGGMDANGEGGNKGRGGSPRRPIFEAKPPLMTARGA
jgi:hypothetical protein